MRKNYPSDLSDKQWNWISGRFPVPEKMGRPKKYSTRQVVNAILYITRTGCQWRQLPRDFPPWRTVYYYFSTWTDSGLLKDIHDAVRRGVRISAQKDPLPTAAIIDSQSVKCTDTTGNIGYDAGKKIKGTKRHIAVDTMGLLLAVFVHSASIQDRDAANDLFDKMEQGDGKNIELVWADGAYGGQLVLDTEANRDYELEIVRRSDKSGGFKVIAKRWVVERTISWLDRNRRLSKNYERLASRAEAFVYLGMTKLMLNRLHRRP